jgi:hypothetical protein
MMKTIAPTVPMFICMAMVAIALTGCNAISPGIPGSYKVVDIEKSLAGITKAPKRGARQMPMDQYKLEFAKRYKGKSLQFADTAKRPFPVPAQADGSVEGIFRGAWKTDEKDGTIHISRWLSGSMYTPWGKAKRDERGLSVELLDPREGTSSVLYFQKTK